MLVRQLLDIISHHQDLIHLIVLETRKHSSVLIFIVLEVTLVKGSILELIEFKRLCKQSRMLLYSMIITCDMPDGAILTVAEGATEPTIHIQVATIHDLGAKLDPTTMTTVDTKFTVDKVPYTGNCSLCGERRHDDKHCRMKSYEDETKSTWLIFRISLTMFSWIR